MLYELNQPLHAFDLASLRGPAVVIRRAVQGEVLRTLDGKNRTLDSEMLVIADAEVPCALAGVMGGEASEVTERTRDVFLECAYFAPKRVRRAARGLGLDTDASYRFQRGIDPAGLPGALKRLAELVLTLAGGTLEGSAADVNPIAPGRCSVRLRPGRVSQLLGVELDRETIRTCLEPIGFELREGKEGAFEVEVPTWRPDVEREADLIEEVARRHGYDKFPEELRNFRPSMLGEDSYFELVARLRELMIGLGFLEAKSSPFAPEREGEVRLLNPLSEREDHLRRDLLSGLIHRVEYNFTRGQRDIRLFEIGTVFRASDGPVPNEHIRVAAAWTGRRAPTHWSVADADWDTWDLKSIFDVVRGLAAPGTELRPLDPAAAGGLEETLAVVSRDGQVIGWAGRVAAGAMDAPRWAGAVWAFELDTLLGPRPQIEYRPTPDFPAVERDLSLVVPKRTLAAEVEVAIRQTAPDYLEALTVFDVYEGEELPSGTRSLAWRLRFRSPDRTLTDQEVDGAIARIVGSLQEKLNVRVRGA